MGFFQSIKDILGLGNKDRGLPDRGQNNNIPIQRRDDDWNRETFRREFFNDNDDGPSREFPGRRGFSIFSDPLEIHQYFEHQMNEMMKMFGLTNFGDYGGFPGSFHTPAIEGYSYGEDDIKPNAELRDRYLKPGYEEPKVIAPEDRVDKDIDGRLSIGDLDSIFRGRSSQTKFFGQSLSSRTIVQPDGSVEVHKTVRDHDGNEETTITKRLGDKEFSITKRRNKNGEEETITNLINMDEDEVDKFFGHRGNNTNRIDDGREENPHNWFPYDRFFK